MLCERLGFSERRACRLLGQNRSTQRHEPKPKDDEQLLRRELREISRKRPRWGYRRACAQLRGEGRRVNRKRIQRIWREEGLRVPQRKRKRRRTGNSTVPAERLRANRPDHVWALDFQFDQTTDGRALKLLNVVDEFTREALAIEARRRIGADDVVAVLERLAVARGAPEHVRMDNGSELTAHAISDWCRFATIETAYIEPGSPWQNPWIESFNGRLRDELLDVELFETLTEARLLAEDFRIDYNTNRPHSALGMLEPPTESTRDSHSGWTDGWGPVNVAVRFHFARPCGSIARREPWGRGGDRRRRRAHNFGTELPGRRRPAEQRNSADGYRRL